MKLMRTPSQSQVMSCSVVALTAPYSRLDTSADHPSNGHRNCVWLRVETWGGVVGWGEAYWGAYATLPTAAALERCIPLLLGLDAQSPEMALAKVRFRTRYWASRGLGAQALSAVEGALWDIYGKLQRRPVWDLLGGTSEPVRVYASAGDNALDADEIYTQASRFARMGFTGYKMRCGGGHADKGVVGDLSRDIERVSAARTALGHDRLLMVDVAVPQRPEMWSIDYAERYIAELEPFSLAFLEEPAGTYDVAGYARLQRDSKIPVAGGESFTSPEEYEPFFAANALGVVQPDAAVVGGPASCVVVGQRARQHDVPVAVHAWSAGVGLAQNLHAAAAIPGLIALEWPVAEHPTASEPLEASTRLLDGFIHPPSEPGLGVQVSEKLLAEYAYRPGFERDY